MVVSKGFSERVSIKSGYPILETPRGEAVGASLAITHEMQARMTLGLDNPLTTAGGIQTNFIPIESPETLTYKKGDDSYYSAIYNLATFYFTNCSILSSTIIRLKDEALRSGIEWYPKFESKCPMCEEKHTTSVTKCAICGFEGTFIKANIAQRKLFTNWEGGSMIDKCNRYGWDLYDLANWFIISSLVYNQPVCLCKSIYIANQFEDISAEIPQEFVPIPASNAKMIFDSKGNPGDGTGFRVTDRTTKLDMNNGDIVKSGRTVDGFHVYPARWEIMKDAGNTGNGTLYSSKEIYHKTFGLTSINYGMPRSMLIATNIKAWIAFESRIEKYLSTGHPQGVFVINGITPTAFQTLRKDIEIQMKSDPYTIPMMGIPPIQDKVNNAKWIPFMAEPTKGLIELKQELLERIVSAFGSSQLMTNDTDSMKGTANDETQFAVIDRTLESVRSHTNAFLAWLLSKYPEITDWGLMIVEPSDEQRRNELDEENRRLINAQLYKNLGFEIVSQNDGNIEISKTPASFDPITRMLGPSLTDNTKPEGDEEGNNLPSKTEPPVDLLDESMKSGEAVDAELFGRAFAEAMKAGVKFK